MSNLETFVNTFSVQLEKAVREYPVEYMFPAHLIPQVVERMSKAFIGKSYNKDSRAIKATCKILGIKHTYTAINEYLQGVQS